MKFTLGIFAFLFLCSPLFAKIEYMASGYGHNCVASKSKVYCWGNQTYEKEFFSIENLVAGDRFSCVVYDEGKVNCFGTNSEGPLNVPNNLGRSKKISAGYRHACIVNEKDEVICWGRTTEDQTNVPSVLKGNKIHELALSAWNSCAVYGDNRDVACFGRRGNETRLPNKISKVKYILNGQFTRCWVHLGETKLNCVGRYPLEVDFKGVEKFIMGYNHACYIKDKTLKCWGNNGENRLKIPTGLDHGKIVKMTTNGQHSCAVTSDQNVSCWGRGSTNQLNIPLMVDKNEEIHNVEVHTFSTCIKSNKGSRCSGLSGLVYQGLSQKATLEGGEFKMGGTIACATNNQNELSCVGRNNEGQQNIPEEFKKPKSFKIGRHHICAENFKGKFGCWGRNNERQTTTKFKIKNLKRYDSEGFHSCLIDQLGLYCWGDNRFGQTMLPRELDPKKVLDFKVGVWSTCALLMSGEYKCWGDITSDEEDFINYVAPESRKITLGVKYACAWLKSGDVDCFGRGDGHGGVNVPKHVKNVKHFDSGDSHSCAFIKGKGLTCWGRNNYRQTTVIN
ncbi:RCC1 domain-containing protein, partial [Bacteriovoracaceae bacterium]|nr:RCC1 domain-containing protein [Bacteriovoracaceae bacterium]